MTLYACPTYIIANVERLIAGTHHSTEDALSALIEHGLRRLNRERDKDRWIELSEAATGKQQDYSDPDDWDMIVALKDEFRFTIDDCHTQRRVRNFRTPEATRSAVNIIADKLGMRRSTLAQVLILDGLRTQEGVMHIDAMSTTVDDFFRKLRKRTRQLASLLKTMDAELCEDVQTLIAEIEP